MHASVIAWAADTVDRYRLAGRPVLDVGSLDVNGSLRHLFTGPYHGIDKRPGPGVDQVADAHHLFSALRPRRFDVIVCTEMLEHDDAPWLSLQTMRYVAHVAPGDRSHLLLSCRGYDERGCFPVHAYPDDLWRFSVPGVRALLEHCGWEPVDVRPDPEAPGVLAIAR